MEKDLIQFAKKTPSLFWSTKSYGKLSAEVILENTLNYGDWEDVQKIFKIMGLSNASKVFDKIANKKRMNLRPSIKHYFKLYFEKYA